MCHLISKAKAGWGPWMGGSIGMPGVCRLLEKKKNALGEQQRKQLNLAEWGRARSRYQRSHWNGFSGIHSPAGRGQGILVIRASTR